jgi:hypothetical protein
MIPSRSAVTVMIALRQVTVILAALFGRYLSVSSFLSLATLRMSIAGHPLLSLNFSRSPETDFRADFYSRIEAG